MRHLKLIVDVSGWSRQGISDFTYYLRHLGYEGACLQLVRPNYLFIDKEINLFYLGQKPSRPNHLWLTVPCSTALDMIIKKDVIVEYNQED